MRLVEAELGHHLPNSYVELARAHNGGVLIRSVFPTTQPTSWADDHVAVTTLAAIGNTAPFSLCGELGSAFWMRE